MKVGRVLQLTSAAEGGTYLDTVLGNAMIRVLKQESECWIFDQETNIDEGLSQVK